MVLYILSLQNFNILKLLEISEKFLFSVFKKIQYLIKNNGLKSL